MDEDKHLGTGVYDPEKYWSARARHSGGDVLSAVCVFGAIPIENKSADRLQRHLMRSALRRVPGHETRRVLEYGCGAGRWIDFFRGWEWHGVDVSDEMLAMARAANSGSEFRKIVNNRIPYPDGAFDVVYSVTVVHHNPYALQQAILGEMYRVLRKNGYLILLEDTCATRTFNMYPRPVEGWMQVAEEQGFRHVWHRHGAYWILRGFLVWVVRKITASREVLNTAEGGSPAVSFGRRLVGRLDYWLDALLLGVVPRKRCTTAVMLFEKAGADGKAQG